MYLGRTATEDGRSEVEVPRKTEAGASIRRKGRGSTEDRSGSECTGEG